MEEIHFESRKKFRTWLKNNFNKSNGIWMIYYKNRSKPCIKYDEALEEALCYGWIDSIIKKIDEQKYLRKFTPRRPKSIWSEKNKNLVVALIENNKMTVHGFKLIEAAKQNGEWDIDRNREANKISEKQIMEFVNLMNNYPKSKEIFISLNKSSQRMYTGYYLSAKKEETRIVRLQRIAEGLIAGKALL